MFDGLDHLNNRLGTRMPTSSVEIVTFMNAAFLVSPWRGRSRLQGQDAVVDHPASWSMRALCPASGVRFGSARTSMPSSPHSQKLSKHTGTTWDPPTGTLGAKSISAYTTALRITV